MIESVAAKRAEVAELCRRYHVRRLDVFGSAARGVDFTDESDIDLLIEYEPGHTPSWHPFFELRESFAALFGREVDLAMDSAIKNPYLRASIERSREPLHGP